MVAAFRALHAKGRVLVLANAWDAASARLVEDAGGKAIATSSAALAWACGYADGGALPPEELLGAVERIRRVTTLPLSVDLEDGYASEAPAVAQLVERVAERGAAGINLEDGEAEPTVLEAKIVAIKRRLAESGRDVFVNARIDVYLRDLFAPTEMLHETLARIARYERAGADGIFVPLVAENDIAALVSATGLPLNVLSQPTLPALPALRDLGVRRLSAGASIGKLGYAAAARAMQSFLRDGAYPAIDSAENVARIDLNTLLGAIP